MRWETIIGLETHVELRTARKLFCPCPAAFGAPPNTQCCPVCGGAAGEKPVLNEEAVRLAVRAGLALGCEVAPESGFDRKHYTSPDLPKGYQITQCKRPLCRGGGLVIDTGDGQKNIRIREIHLEEDAAKRSRIAPGKPELIDLNRSGLPLIEIVTEPDIRSGPEAVAYLTELRAILRTLGVSDGKLQEGSLRCDVNLSVQRAGEGQGVRVELKNLGSFRAVSKAVDFEAARQIALLTSGGTLRPETRRWDEQREETLAMRAKESARDYRCCTEPDLPPLVLTREEVETQRAALPALPREKRARYVHDWGLAAGDAALLAAEPALARLLEETAALGAAPAEAAKWILGGGLRNLSARGLEAEQMPLTAPALARVVALVREGQVNRGTAEQVLDAVFDGQVDVDEYVRARGLTLVCDPADLTAAAEAALRAHPKSVCDYRAGKERAFGFLMGQAMRALGGQAAPGALKKALEQALIRLEETGTGRAD